MKIVSIFADRLFAFQYEGSEENELDRLLELWSNPGFLYAFLTKNRQDLPKDLDWRSMAEQLLDSVDMLQDLLIQIHENPEISLDQFFVPLVNLESAPKVLSLRKRRISYLRLYALRIDSDCFVITGGTIKLTHLMQERIHTTEELYKLQKARDYLKSKGVFDNDSFFEFLSE
ncbi:hypothetical protein ACFSQD_15250 [Flavihumibacter stibioxidans]|uniref:Uncharacterized protein n=1 Tax=Flavihumibacter stibioxidans TaxID=1834163 RepID=A0ABR7M7Q2_9BACT|nr:hypothetical protein [Flavihumibacter stibioxidans]MBC6491038.1 hypothetical protein [Flavihumibacter stibioxidans]